MSGNDTKFIGATASGARYTGRRRAMTVTQANKAVNDALSGGGTVTSLREIYVDPVLGVDSTADGTSLAPFATINAAYASIEIVENTQDGADQWLLEKVILHLAPGIYTEGGTVDEPNDVEIGIKRARTSLQGDGVQILGNINNRYSIDVVPGGWDYGTTYRPNQAWPYDSTSGTAALVCFDIQGASGGMEGGHPTMNIQVKGEVATWYGDETDSGTSWQEIFGVMMQMFDRVQFFDGITVRPEDGATVVNASMTCEVNDSSVAGGCIGAINSTDSSIFYTFKSHNSQLKSVIGPTATINEIDNCRIQGGFNREYDGATNGNITFTGIGSYAGIRDCAVASSMFQVGNGTTSPTIYCDEMTANQLLTKTLDAGTGTVVLSITDIKANTTANRPAIATVPIGYRYFDTTLGYAIWSNGTDWVDATGTTV